MFWPFNYWYRSVCTLKTFKIESLKKKKRKLLVYWDRYSSMGIINDQMKPNGGKGHPSWFILTESTYTVYIYKKTRVCSVNSASRWLLLLKLWWRATNQVSTWSADVFLVLLYAKKRAYSISCFLRQRPSGLDGFCSHAVGANDQPKLEIDRKVMQYRRYEKLYPNSTCKEHCDAKKGLVPYLQVCCPFRNSFQEYWQKWWDIAYFSFLKSNNSCCPDCKKCEPFEMIQGGHCQPCPNGFMPNENRSRCLLIDEQIIDYRNPWAAGSMAFASFGKYLHLCFIPHSLRPCVRSRRLSYFTGNGVIIIRYSHKKLAIKSSLFRKSI